MKIQYKNKFVESAKKKILEHEKEVNGNVKLLMTAYDEAQKEIEDKILALYQRYADENGLSLIEAKKILQGKEYIQFRQGIEEYLKDISQLGKESHIAKELDILSKKSQISRLESLQADIYKEMGKLAEKTDVGLTDVLKSTFKTSFQRQFKELKKGLKIKEGFGELSENIVNALVKEQWSKKHYSKAVWDNTDLLVKNVSQIITKGMVAGHSTQKMAKELDQAMGKGRLVADRLIRTECKHIATVADFESYKVAGVTYYVFMGSSETKYPCVCGLLNNTKIAIDKAEEFVNLPPIHPNCKCTTRAYFEDSIFDNNDDIAESEDTTLTEDEEYALNYYKSFKSYELNSKLRYGEPLTQEEESITKNLDSAIDKMPKYNGTLYRSLSDHNIPDVKEYINRYKENEGGTITYPQYISTSKTIYDSSFPIQYVIQSKQGADISKYNQKEQEVLFKRDTTFVITKIEGHTIFMEEI